MAGVLLEDERAHDGMLFSEAAGGFKSADTAAPPTFVVTAEQYNRIARAVEKKLPVAIRLNLKAAVSDRDVDGLNIIGEIPGGEKKDEIVMIGAHFDSWHSGTGATDNGAGSAVMIEVMRILKALNLKLDRTVRIGLWGGEEQGLFGSRAYVKEHFADPKTMRLTAEHGKLSGYFNLDNGSGKIRGVYLQGHDAMRPVFEAWLAPFRDMGVTTITIRNTGGTDHLSFDAVGLPGFPVHPGSAGLRHHHAPLQHGHVGSRRPRGPDAGLGRDRDDGVPDRDAQGDAAAAGIAEGRVAGRPFHCFHSLYYGSNLPFEVSHENSFRRAGGICIIGGSSPPPPRRPAPPPVSPTITTSTSSA